MTTFNTMGAQNFHELKSSSAKRLKVSACIACINPITPCDSDVAILFQISMQRNSALFKMFKNNNAP